MPIPSGPQQDAQAPSTSGAAGTTLPNGVNLANRKTYGQTGTPLTSEQVAQILYQAGFRGDALVYFTAIARRETGNYPATHGTEADPSKLSGDLGLFGLNYVNDTPAARAAVGYTSRADWFDPLVAARMAFYMSNGGTNLSPWKGSKQGYSDTGDPYFGLNMDSARTAVTNAEGQGLLGQDWTGSGAFTGATGAATTTGPLKLPSDASLYRTPYGIEAVFDVGGVKLGYAVNWSNGSVDLTGKQITNVSAEQYGTLGIVDAGDAEELRGMSGQFPTYKQFWDSILSQVMGKNNPAASDPEVMKVIAEFAGRPDMTAAELQNKLQATQWYQTHTQNQLEWNGLSDAEKTKRKNDTAATMIDTLWQFSGEQVDQNDPRIANYLEQVASGQMGIGAFTEIVKQQAAQNANSPWGRQLSDEQKAQKQGGVDVENTAQRVLDLAHRWGINMSNQTANDWAGKIVKNDASDADVLASLQSQAKVLYPWSDGKTEIATQSQPWIDTYNRVMEKSTDLFNPQIQGALTKGASPWEFEQQLKLSGDWRNTKNYRQQASDALTRIGQTMGFNS